MTSTESDLLADAPWADMGSQAAWQQVSEDRGQGSTEVSAQSVDGTGEELDPDTPEVTIVLMGATGSGKSSFINIASGSNLRVGDGLRSCTSTVQPAPAFKLDDRRVVLVDMPGFDDTTRSDTEILEILVDYLMHSHKVGRILTGVLYFHRISDIRMGGTSTRNLNMFKKLCGDTAFNNVVIVTNMWGEVDSYVGAAREAELATDDLFFKPILGGGAWISRHDNTAPSAQTIIRHILRNPPQLLRIQEELLEGKHLSQTGAGEELNSELNAHIRRYEEEMRVLRQDMEQATKEKDEAAKKEIEAETKKVAGVLARFKNDAIRLAYNRRGIGSGSGGHLARRDGREPDRTTTTPNPQQGQPQSRPPKKKGHLSGWKVLHLLFGNRTTPRSESEGENGGVKATGEERQKGELGENDGAQPARRERKKSELERESHRGTEPARRETKESESEGVNGAQPTKKERKGSQRHTNRS